jgi:uncharacterized protein YjbI with pentapeptide repeats
VCESSLFHNALVADLRGADLTGANFSEDKLKNSNIEQASEWARADLRGVLDQSAAQIAECRGRRAIVDIQITKT